MWPWTSVLPALGLDFPTEEVNRGLDMELLPLLSWGFCPVEEGMLPQSPWGVPKGGVWGGPGEIGGVSPPPVISDLFLGRS